MLRTPDFWYGSSGQIWGWLLTPLSWIYGGGGKLRQALVKPLKVSIPVISIGNSVAGGSGKTPVAMALAKVLQKRGHTPHFVTRGYGGREVGPVRVDPALHTYQDVGDEALLLAEVAPTWISRKRAEGAEEVVTAGATHIILDDGHQHPTLHKDFSLVVVDGAQGFGNGRVIPAGPLREPLEESLKRADALLVIGEEALPPLPGDLPLFRAFPTYGPLAKGPFLAFAGLGFPQKFFDAVKAKGAPLVGTQAFPDHYPYTPSDMESLAATARAQGAHLMTTAKDRLRLPPAFCDQVDVLSLEISLPEDLMLMIEKVTP